MVILRFADASLGTILYCANGARTMGTERVEASCQGRAAWCEDFRDLVLCHQGKRTKQRFWLGGKGHRQEIERFVKFANGQTGPPISFREIVATSYTVFRIEQALAEGTELPIDLNRFFSQ